MESVVKHYLGLSLFELILKIKGYPIRNAEYDFANLTSLEGQEFEAWQDHKRWEIVKFHYQNNPFYRDVVGTSLPERWEELPVMTKATYQIEVLDMLSEPYKSKKDVYIANTSGSSGHPFYFAKDKYAHALAWALIKDRYAKKGIGFNSLQGRFYGIPLEAKGYWVESIKDLAMNRIRFPVFDLSEPQLEKIYATIVKKKVNYLYGYTSAVVLLARYLVHKGIVLKSSCPSLVTCIVTSEVCTKEDLQIMKKAFGVMITNEYGASELGIMAFENDDGELVGSDELIYFESVPNEQGLNELLCTSLFNKAFPIIRYKIGDLVEISTRNGRTIFRDIVGRTNDLVKLPSGKIAAGLTFYYVSRSILEASGVLKEFIIRQTSFTEFEFDIVADRALTAKEENLIRGKTELYLEPNLSIKFNYLDKINRPASGKIKHFYSEF